MVIAVQCPEMKCRKYMLVEEHERGKIVHCLICKAPIRVGEEPPPPPTGMSPKIRVIGQYGQ